MHVLIILDKVIFLQSANLVLFQGTQLLSITHEICQSFCFSSTRDIKGVFLDFSKAFNKVWREGLLFKLQSYGIEGSLLGLIKNYLTTHQQRVVLNGQTSSLLNVTASLPQGSVLRPLLFLIYINDLSEEITSSCKIFTDDTSLENREQKLL